MYDFLPYAIGLVVVLTIATLLFVTRTANRTAPTSNRSTSKSRNRKPAKQTNRSKKRTHRLNLKELARRLDVSADDLKRFRPQYHETRIPKRSGGVRILHVPDESTRALQKRIQIRLLAKLSAHASAKGFERGRSIKDNAEPHIGRDAVVRMDVKDFFPNTHEKHVRRLFERLNWDRQCVQILVDATVHHGGLPQGAPTSPRLSNLVNFHLDRRLDGLANAVGAAYTRYADDLTFSFGSSEQAHNPTFRRLRLWQRIRIVLKTTEKILGSRGYELHQDQKRSIKRKNARQIVTGVIVNDKAAIPRSRRRWIRAVQHRFRTGQKASITARQLQGWLSFQQMVTGKPITQAEWQELRKWQQAETKTASTNQPLVANASSLPLSSLADVVHQIKKLTSFDTQRHAMINSLKGQVVTGDWLSNRRPTRITRAPAPEFDGGYSVHAHSHEFPELVVDLLFRTINQSLVESLEPGAEISGHFEFVEWDTTFDRPRLCYLGP